MESLANVLVMALFGLLAGVLLQVQRALGGDALARRRPGEGVIAGARRRAEEATAMVRSGPRSYLVVNLAVLGVVAMLVLSLLFSPLEMQWWVFLGSVFAGYLAAGGLLSLARRRRLTLSGGSVFDVLPPDSESG